MSEKKNYSYPMTQCTACGNFLSAMACNFGCPHCGYTDGWDTTIPPLESIKGVGNDEKGLRINSSSNEKSQSTIRKINSSDTEITNKTPKSRQSEVWWS